MSRHYRVHAALRGIDITLCCRKKSAVHFTERVREYVDCRVCLYHLRLYTPLIKLRETQLEYLKRDNTVFAVRLMVLGDLYSGTAFPLTLDGPNGTLSYKWTFRTPEWRDNHKGPL